MQDRARFVRLTDSVGRAPASATDADRYDDRGGAQLPLRYSLGRTTFLVRRSSTHCTHTCHCLARTAKEGVPDGSEPCYWIVLLTSVTWSPSMVCVVSWCCSRACVRACVCVCVRARVRGLMILAPIRDLLLYILFPTVLLLPRLPISSFRRFISSTHIGIMVLTQ